MSRPTYTLIARVASASEPGRTWDVKTDVEVLTCACWPWRRARTCRHVADVAPRVQALGGIQSVLTLMQRNPGLTIDANEARPPRLDLVSRIGQLLEDAVEQEGMHDHSWRIEWLRLSRELTTALSHVPAPVAIVHDTGWVGGGRAIILRD